MRCVFVVLAFSVLSACEGSDAFDSGEPGFVPDAAYRDASADAGAYAADGGSPYDGAPSDTPTEGRDGAALDCLGRCSLGALGYYYHAPYEHEGACYTEGNGVLCPEGCSPEGCEP